MIAVVCVFNISFPFLLASVLVATIAVFLLDETRLLLRRSADRGNPLLREIKSPWLLPLHPGLGCVYVLLLVWWCLGT